VHDFSIAQLESGWKLAKLVALTLASSQMLKLLTKTQADFSALGRESTESGLVSFRVSQLSRRTHSSY